MHCCYYYLGRGTLGGQRGNVADNSFIVFSVSPVYIIPP
jgi:hypothetical protein